MQENDYLDFNFNDLPEIFYNKIDGIEYRFRLYYNRYDDSFHIDIWDQYGVQLVMGEKLVYGKSLWNSINDPRLPMTQLVPIDDGNHESTVSRLNFPNIVKLEFLDSTPADAYEDAGKKVNNGNSTDVDDNDYGNDPMV